MNKILEIKNNDWLKGISAHPNIASGGLFQLLNGVDPFEEGGIAKPSLSPANQTLGTTPKFLINFNSSSVGYVYAQSDTKLYQVLKDSPYTVTDVTSEINQHLTFGTPTTQIGATIWKGKFIYATISSTGNGYISSGAIPVLAASDVLIKDGYNNRETMIFCQGVDGNLYYNYGVGQLGVLTSATGTAGNGTTVFIDNGFQIRDIQNDGRYLVIIADNNALDPANRVVGSYQCKTYYWDMVQTDANSRIVPDFMYDTNDSYFIAGPQLGDTFFIFGYNGIYAASAGTRPKMIRPFPVTTGGISHRPLNPYQVCVNNGSIYWLDGVGAYGTIYAYGNPNQGQQKIFYEPYIFSGGYTEKCIVACGTTFILGTTQPGLFIFNVGTTRGSARVTTIAQTMESPHRYDLTKVVLSGPLTSGQTVQCTVYGQGGTSQISTETKSYSAANPKQTLIFKRIPTGNQQDKFEDITVTVITGGGAGMRRISTYASPLGDVNEEL